jgi:hypothetical protein
MNWPDGESCRKATGRRESSVRHLRDGHGRLTVTFRLGPRTAAHALIRVSAKLGHEAVVESTLSRHRR